MAYRFGDIAVAIGLALTTIAPRADAQTPRPGQSLSEQLRDRATAGHIRDQQRRQRTYDLSRDLQNDRLRANQRAEDAARRAPKPIPRGSRR